MRGRTSSTRLAEGGEIVWTHWAGTAPHAVVLIHGIGNQAASWFEIPEMFASHNWRTTAIDLRGHGRSVRCGPFSVDQFASDVTAVLHYLGIATPILIGHSLGALVCTSLAGRTDIRPRAVINIDQPLRLTDFAALIRTLWPNLKADFSGTIVPVFESMMPHALAAAIREVLTRDYATMSPSPAMDIWSPLVELESEQVAALVDEMLAGINIPYLALHGSDPGIGYSEWLRQRLPGAELEVWDGCQHFPHLLYPERFVSRVVEFASAA